MTESSTYASRKAKLLAIILAKLTIALGLLYFVLRRVDDGVLLSLFFTIPIMYPLIAFILMNLSVFTSALRSRLYFGHSGLEAGRWFFVRLYYVGMLFNIVLPGGIGGDAYKVYIMWKKSHFPRLQGVRLMLCERVNGVALLGIIGAIILPLSDFWLLLQSLLPIPLAFYWVLVVLMWPAYLFVGHLLLKDNVRTMMLASGYSACGQALQVMMATALLIGVYPTAELVTIYNYLFLFAVSSVISILPVSIGGVGLREATFLFGLGWINAGSKEAGIALAMLVFAMQALSSLIGIACLYGLHVKPYKASTEL